MTKVVFETSMSLDGYLAGPNATLDEPLGKGGEGLHEWVVGLATFQRRHGRSGGETGRDDDLLKESFASTGATIIGRKMFSGGTGPWEQDPKATGWWGDEPPFGFPVFVLTHHARDPLVLGETTFTFVTEGIESALEQALAAAGDRNVAIGGGASVAQQYLRAGLVDELLIHVAPLLLGGGVRVFDDAGGELPALECTDVIASPAVTHLRYRVRR